MTLGELKNVIRNISEEGYYNPDAEIKLRSVAVPKEDLDCADLTIDIDTRYCEENHELLCLYVDIVHS